MRRKLFGDVFSLRFFYNNAMPSMGDERDDDFHAAIMRRRASHFRLSALLATRSDD